VVYEFAVRNLLKVSALRGFDIYKIIYNGSLSKESTQVEPAYSYWLSHKSFTGDKTTPEDSSFESKGNC